jgi:Ni/Co efflux regulator RcnB
MFKKALAFAAAAVCLSSTAAFAQSTDYRSGGQRGDRYDRQDNRDSDSRYDRSNRRSYTREDRRDYRRDDGYSRNQYSSRSNNIYHDGYRGQRQQRHQMRRGERMSQYYRGDYYVVNDWRTHRLHAPHHGYHWVQSGSDFAMVAIATGIIASVLSHH